MQDIVFYAAANETLGVVRDYANVRNQSAPILVLGVSCRLKMRLFADSESATAYPIAAFSGISTWKWRMDADFDRDTPSKLVADAGNISVQTVTDTINDETLSFTEFTIPISDMNTVELTEWLGTEKKRSGLTGELVGYDSSGNAVFVLQIDDFTVRNRVAGLNEPTSNQQVYLTSSQTELLVQSAISSAAATKQDTLTSANAGIGIAITSGGTISTSNVPMSAVTGLTAALSGLQTDISGKQDKLTSANAGSGISVDSNGIISNTYSLPYATTGSAGGVMLADGTEVVAGTNTSKAVTPAALNAALTGGTQFVPQEVISSFRAVTDLGSAATVSLAAGKAYKLSAISGNHYITVDSAPAGKYGDDAHLELFVSNSALVHFTAPLVLFDPLVPNAGNDIVIRFRDGMAEAYVEDSDIGYAVTVAGGTGEGTLAYAMTTASSPYVIFSEELDGTTYNLTDITPSAAKYLHGEGVGNTIVTGSLVSSYTIGLYNLTVSNLTFASGQLIIGGGTELNGMLVSGGTVNFSGMNVVNGTVSGGVVSISGGTTTGGVFNPRTFRMNQGAATISGATITGGAGNAAGTTGNTVSFINCLVTGNTTSNSGGGMAMYGGDLVVITGCTFTGNRAYFNNDAFYSAARHVILNDFEASQGTSDRSAYIQIGAGTISYPLILDLNDIRMDGAINVLGGNLLNEIRIVAGSTVSIKGDTNSRAIYIRQDLTGLHCQISVGSYDDSGEWVVGGTASFITYDGSSTVSISGTGTTSLTNTGILS